MTEDAEDQAPEGHDSRDTDAERRDASDSGLPDGNSAAAFESATDVPGTHLKAAEFWDDVVADMEATAAEYEADGWETVQLHPGDVTAYAPDDEDDRFGLDVLVPNNEFDAVEDLLAGAVAFDSYEAFVALSDGLVLLVVAMEDADEEVAVLYPAYYDVQNAEGMLAAAQTAGEMRTYVRTLTDERIEFTHEEPETFAPPASPTGDEGGET